MPMFMSTSRGVRVSKSVLEKCGCLADGLVWYVRPGRR